MKTTRVFLFIAVLIICLVSYPATADDLDDLMGLSDDMGMDSDEVSNIKDGSGGIAATEENGLSINFGGYIKSSLYWNQEKYSDVLWAQFSQMTEKPSSQKIDGINNLGTTAQLRIEGFLGSDARFFSAFNLTYNRARSLHTDPVASDISTKQNGDIRLVESYVELFEGSRVWKIGPQIVTWGFMEGIEVPTDRVNARDHSYKSTEYEDSKLSSTGISLTQNVGDSRLNILWIPIANTNVSMEFLDYLYTRSETPVTNQLSNGRIAARFVSNVGPLDYAISYVDGLDPAPDLNAQLVAGNTYIYGREYTKIQSPGIDLQWNFGSWLAKMSWVSYITEDKAGTNPLIKNNWSKTVVGAEFTVLDNSVNLYVGQTAVENFQNDQTSFLLGQIAENMNFVSGHVNASFLTGDALNLIVMAANYWNDAGDTVQTILRSTLTYKLSDGFEVLFSPAYMNLMDTLLSDVQLEVKYSF